MQSGRRSRSAVGTVHNTELLPMVEFVMQTLGELSPLSLLTLSEGFVRAGAPEASCFQTLG